MTLPAELLDYILSFLQSDPATLKTCSETHPSLCQLAEPYIYSHILLTTDDESTDLIDTLSKRPYIVNYIRSLEIDVGGGHGTETQRRLEEIATILPNLLALREITFDHSPSSAFVWAGQLPLAWLDCCLRLQSMRDVCITHVVCFSFLLLNGERKSIRALTVRGGNIQIQVLEQMMWIGTVLCPHSVSDYVWKGSCRTLSPGLQHADHSFDPWSFSPLIIGFMIHFLSFSPAVQIP